MISGETVIFAPSQGLGARHRAEDKDLRALVNDGSKTTQNVWNAVNFPRFPLSNIFPKGSRSSDPLFRPLSSHCSAENPESPCAKRGLFSRQCCRCKSRRI